MLVDVRPREQWAICRLPRSLHAPYKTFDQHLEEIKAALALAAVANGNGSGVGAGGKAAATVEAATDAALGAAPLYVVCRRGNDSQRAVAWLRAAGLAQAKDVVGGVEAWAAEVDPSFPVY